MGWLCGLSGLAWAAQRGTCPVCGMNLPCPMNCVGSTTTASGERLMIMAGMPVWFFVVGMALILSVSFISIELLHRRGSTLDSYWRFNLLTLSWLKAWLKQPWSKFSLQLPVFLVFCLIIYAGLFGHAIINIAPILTWTIWWAGLIFLILLLGKAWCVVCPWDFVATIFQQLKPFGVAKEPFTLGMKWPRWLKNIYLAMGLFILLTWFELGFKVTSSPRFTALLGIIMVVLAVAPAMIFGKKPFCKYGCLVGRISGLYAMFSPIEVRSAEPSVCAMCRTKDCYSGNARGNPCPTSLVVSQLKENTYCLLCAECVRSCPHDNVAINVRPFATDLLRFKTARNDEAWLAVILLALTSFHGLTMTSVWDSASGWSVIGFLQTALGLSRLSAFSLGMGLVNGFLILMYALICIITQRVAGNPAVSTKTIFLHYAYSILPIALFYHIAHNGMHFLMEGQLVIPLLSDPLGQGRNYLGTALWQLAPLVSAQGIWVLQVCFVVIGHISGIIIGHHVSRRLYAIPQQAIRSLIPMLIGMVFFSSVSLWLMQLDMKMRSSLM
jgi:ferredoxin